MYEKMIVDADLCIKLGSSGKHSFLCDVLPLIAKNIYMHTYVRSEVKMPPSAVSQLNNLITDGIIKLVDEKSLSIQEKAVYKATYGRLTEVMIDPRNPNKNKGEVCSLAYAKATGIPVFATDERELQPIIDKILNTGMDDITCIRIVDVVHMARERKILVGRKVAKALWIVAGKKKEIFDHKIWPL